MDFEEWFNSLELDNWTNKKYMHDAFKAGQQSKQAEIDALKAELAKREPMGLRDVDIPHGTIVLEK